VIEKQFEYPIQQLHGSPSEKPIPIMELKELLPLVFQVEVFLFLCPCF
jgi:hypothetical protein